MVRPLRIQSHPIFPSSLQCFLPRERAKEYFLKAEKGNLRRLAMDLLLRHGGLSGPEIDDSSILLDVGYSTVSQERKRFRESVEKDGKSENLPRRLEEILSTMKI